MENYFGGIRLSAFVLNILVLSSLNFLLIWEKIQFQFITKVVFFIPPLIVLKLHTQVQYTYNMYIHKMDTDLIINKLFSLLILTIMYSFVLDFICSNIQYINTHRIDLRKDYSILVSLCKLETKG